MKTWRYLLGASGILLLAFGVFRILTEVPTTALIGLGIWLAAAVVIHDGIVSPLVIAVGWAIARAVPPRARRYLQAGLIVAMPVTVIASVLIRRRGTQPSSKALLVQDYAGNLTVLLTVIATASLVAYAGHVATDRARRDAPAEHSPDVRSPTT